MNKNEKANIIVAGNLEILNIISKDVLKRGIYKLKKTNKGSIESIFYDSFSNNGYNLNQDTFSKLRNGLNIKELLHEKKIIALAEYTGIDVGLFIGKERLMIDNSFYEDIENVIELKKLKESMSKQYKHTSCYVIDEDKKSPNYQSIIEEERTEYIDISDDIEGTLFLMNRYMELKIDKNEILLQTNRQFIRELENKKATYMGTVTALALNMNSLDNVIKEKKEEIRKKALNMWNDTCNGTAYNMHWLQVKQFFMRKASQYNEIEFILELLESISLEQFAKIKKERLSRYKDSLNSIKGKVLGAIKLQKA